MKRILQLVNALSLYPSRLYDIDKDSHSDTNFILVHWGVIFYIKGCTLHVVYIVALLLYTFTRHTLHPHNCVYKVCSYLSLGVRNRELMHPFLSKKWSNLRPAQACVCNVHASWAVQCVVSIVPWSLSCHYCIVQWSQCSVHSESIFSDHGVVSTVHCPRCSAHCAVSFVQCPLGQWPQSSVLLGNQWLLILYVRHSVLSRLIIFALLARDMFSQANKTKTPQLHRIASPGEMSCWAESWTAFVWWKRVPL